MALDGFTIASINSELQENLTGGRINKISQPEPDELLINIKNNSNSYKLFISVNPSLPVIYLTDESRPGPDSAPAFCMLLRKYLNGGRIISISQMSLERVIDISIEHSDEMGDMAVYHLMLEFMGKYSNAILTDDDDIIIDALKRISLSLSSVREVLTGRKYFIPGAGERIDPLTLTQEDLFQKINDLPSGDISIFKFLYTNITGISPLLSQEICHRVSIDYDCHISLLTDNDIYHLYTSLTDIINELKNKNYYFAIYPEFDPDKNKSEYSVVRLQSAGRSVEYDSISQLLKAYYSKKEKDNRIRQKSADLKKLTTTFLDRARKKLSIQEDDLRKTANCDKYRMFGELLQAYSYNISNGENQVTLSDYNNNNEPVTIPLKPELTALENANAYFARYNKLKRTGDAALKMCKETKSEIIQLEGILNSLEISESSTDLDEIREELIYLGYLKQKSNDKRKKKSIPSNPMKYITSDGLEVYVGKNNFQNDNLTFKFAKSNDWWFHAKDTAGSHVILKNPGSEIPDRAFEEAASLAAHYSKAGNQDKAEVDYVLKKEVKKPAGSKPGFVVYYTNYSMMASTDISKLRHSE